MNVSGAYRVICGLITHVRLHAACLQGTTVQQAHWSPASRAASMQALVAVACDRCCWHHAQM
jgi:hypothetical protein